MKNLVDLHCHLDGSLALHESFDIAYQKHLIPFNMTFSNFAKLMSVEDDNDSLDTYLKRFDIPIKILQDTNTLTNSTLYVIRDLALDDIAYAELRFAPQHHTAKGLSQEEVVKAVIKGVKQAKLLYPETHVKLILCMMHAQDEQTNHDANKETIDLADKYRGEGVVGIDIAGSESTTALIEYKPLFDYAKKLGLKYTIHAGEINNPENVKTAIELGAERIGHGIATINDLEVLSLVKKTQIPLEVCITSNVQCRNVDKFEDHPLKKLFDEGCNVTLNTDNRTMSSTSEKEEMEKCKQFLNFTDNEIIQMRANAIEAIFGDEHEKQRLRKLNEVNNG